MLPCIALTLMSGKPFCLAFFVHASKAGSEPGGETYCSENSSIFANASTYY